MSKFKVCAARHAAKTQRTEDCDYGIVKFSTMKMMQEITIVKYAMPIMKLTCLAMQTTDGV